MLHVGTDTFCRVCVQRESHINNPGVTSVAIAGGLQSNMAGSSISWIFQEIDTCWKLHVYLLDIAGTYYPNTVASSCLWSATYTNRDSRNQRMRGPDVFAASEVMFLVHAGRGWTIGGGCRPVGTRPVVMAGVRRQAWLTGRPSPLVHNGLVGEAKICRKKSLTNFKELGFL